MQLMFQITCIVKLKGKGLDRTINIINQVINYRTWQQCNKWQKKKAQKAKIEWIINQYLWYLYAAPWPWPLAMPPLPCFPAVVTTGLRGSTSSSLEGFNVLQHLGHWIHLELTQSCLEWLNYTDLLRYIGECMCRLNLLASKLKWDEVEAQLEGWIEVELLSIHKM